MSESEPFNDIQESKCSLVHLKHIQRWLNETHFSKSYVDIKPPSRHFPTRFHFWARTSLTFGTLETLLSLTPTGGKLL